MDRGLFNLYVAVERERIARRAEARCAGVDPRDPAAYLAFLTARRDLRGHPDFEAHFSAELDHAYKEAA